MTKTEKLLMWIQQPSTMKGMVIVASIFGVMISPELQDKIVVSGGLIYSVIQIFVSKD